MKTIENAPSDEYYFNYTSYLLANIKLSFWFCNAYSISYNPIVSYILLKYTGILKYVNWF